MIRHILLIKFKHSLSHLAIDEVKSEFYSMVTKVEGVVDVEWGVNNSPEGKAQGYTHSVLMTFADELARERYLPHPAHNVLKEMFVPLLEDIVVFDYQV